MMSTSVDPASISLVMFYYPERMKWSQSQVPPLTVADIWAQRAQLSRESNGLPAVSSANLWQRSQKLLPMFCKELAVMAVLLELGWR